MRSTIQIRYTIKNTPILNRVEEIAKKRKNQFTPTLMEILELGLRSYDSGMRLVEDVMVNVKDKAIVATNMD